MSADAQRKNVGVAAVAVTTIRANPNADGLADERPDIHCKHDTGAVGNRRARDDRPWIAAIAYGLGDVAFRLGGFTLIKRHVGPQSRRGPVFVGAEQDRATRCVRERRDVFRELEALRRSACFEVEREQFPKDFVTTDHTLIAVFHASSRSCTLRSSAWTKLSRSRRVMVATGF